MKCIASIALFTLLFLTACEKGTPKSSINTNKNPVNSASYERHFVNAENNTHYFAYFENQKWAVREVVYSTEQWPEITNSLEFQTLGDLNNFAAEKSLIEKSELIFLDAVTGSTELKSSTSNELWPVKNNWSWEWELKYANWIHNEIDTNWFLERKIPTDCADVIYTLRWIFARNNNLPMANQLMDRSWFTHRSVKSEWAQLPTHKDWWQDQRFMAALKYVTLQTYTHTLNRDSYPVALTVDSIWPGTYQLQINKADSGHAMLIARRYEASSGIRVTMMASTTPRKIRALTEHIVFQSAYSPNENSIYRMRWPQIEKNKVALVAAEKMPFYSLDQYKEPLDLNRVLNPKPDWKIEFEDTVKSLQSLLESRVLIVQDGVKNCFPNKCKEGSYNYDSFSTPSRDDRIRFLTSYILSTFTGVYPDYKTRQFETIFQLEGQAVTLAQVQFAFMNGYVSSNPNDALHLRWGMGSKFLLQTLKDRINKALIERRTLLKDSEACRTTPCSDKFKQDFKFPNFAHVLKLFVENISYYETETNDLTTPLRALLDETFSDSVYSFKLSKWINLVKSSSSDHQSELALKEGFLNDFFEIQTLSSEGYRYFSKENEAFLIFTTNYPELNFKIFDKKTLNPHYIFDDKELIVQIDLQTGQALVKYDQELFYTTLANPQKDHLISSAADIQGAQTLKLSKDYWYYLKDSKTYRYSFQQREHMLFANISLLSISPDDRFYNSYTEHGRVKITDTQLQTHILTNDYIDLSKIVFTKETASAYIFVTSDKYTKIDKTDEKKLLFFQIADFKNISTTFLLIEQESNINNQTIYEASLNPETGALNKTSILKLKNSIIITREKYLLALEPDTVNFYKISPAMSDNPKLGRYTLTSGKNSITTYENQNFIFKTIYKNQTLQTNILDRKTNRVIYEAGQLSNEFTDFANGDSFFSFEHSTSQILLIRANGSHMIYAGSGYQLYGDIIFTGDKLLKIKKL